MQHVWAPRVHQKARPQFTFWTGSVHHDMPCLVPLLLYLEPLDSIPTDMQAAEHSVALHRVPAPLDTSHTCCADAMHTFADI
jgi:hypothetical protein